MLLYRTVLCNLIILEKDSMAIVKHIGKFRF